MKQSKSAKPLKLVQPIKVVKQQVDSKDSTAKEATARERKRVRAANIAEVSSLEGYRI